MIAHTHDLTFTKPSKIKESILKTKTGPYWKLAELINQTIGLQNRIYFVACLKLIR